MNSVVSTLRTHAATAGFLVLAALWGGSFVAIEVGLHYFPTFTFAALRYSVAGVVVLAYAALRSGPTLPRTRDDTLQVSLSGVLVIAVYHAALYAGETLVGGSIAAVVISLTPVLTAALASVFVPDERVTAVEGVGFLLGVVGVAVVANPTPGALDGSLVGIGLVLVAGVAFSLGAVLSRPLHPRMGMAAQQGWAMFGGSLLLFAGAAGNGETLAAISWTPTALAAFLYLTFGSAVVGFALYFSLLANVGATKSNLVGYLEPVAAAVVAWVVLGHVVSTTTLLGFLAILAGFVVIHGDHVVAAARRTQRWSTGT